MYDVSIIVPTYRPNEYLKECVNSLIDQSLDGSRFEIIIVLNGPKEPYYSSISTFISEFQSHKVSLYYIEQNGVSHGRNKGIQKAKGTFIGFVDDDDLVSNNYLESLLRSAPHNGISCSNVKTFTENIKATGDDYLTRAFIKNKEKSSKGLLANRSFTSSVCAKLIPKTVIGERRFNSDFKIGEDSLFIALISDRIAEINLPDEDVIYYRRLRAGSASRKRNTIAFEIRNSTKQILQYLRIYFKKPLKYNLPFFLARVLAVLRSFVIRLQLR